MTSYAANFVIPELSEDTVQLCGRPAALRTTQMCACHITACFLQRLQLMLPGYASNNHGAVCMNDVLLSSMCA